MTPPDVITRLKDIGLDVSVTGDRIDVTGDTRQLTDTLRSAIRQHKIELLELLQQPANDPEPAPEPIIEPPPHVARCEQCGGRSWGCVGATAG